MLTIRRDVFTASVLAGLKDSLMDPALVREFAAEYHRKLNRLNTARIRGMSSDAASWRK